MLASARGLRLDPDVRVPRGCELVGDPCSPGFGAMCTVDAEGDVTVVCLDA